MVQPRSVLVLGASGMLGSTVVHRLQARHADWRIEGTTREASHRLALEAEAGRLGLGDLFRLGRYDHVVNCIGVLKNAIDDRDGPSIARAIHVNALFPHEVADLAAEQQSRVIHISSDAVFSGRRRTPYTEEEAPDPIEAYGMTKALGESPASNVLNVRCSIVGRDSRKRGLVEWYLAGTSDSVIGYTDYVWTPVTTVQVADLCEALIRREFDAVRRDGHVVHFAPNPPLSKADFLERLRDMAGRGPTVEPRPRPDGPCYRILGSRSRALSEILNSNLDWSSLLPELLAEFSTRGV